MKVFAKIDSLINYLSAAALATIGVLIFTNVVMRYFFNAGLTWAEEFSRFLFVWLIFVSALGALKDNSHLGFASVVQRFSPAAKIACYLVCNAVVLGCLGILFYGSIGMTSMTTNAFYPSTGIPLAFVYVSGAVLSGGMFLIVCYKMYQAMFVPGAIDTLILLKESHDEAAEPLQSQESKGGRS